MKKICVFCGSNLGEDKIFVKQAQKLIREMVYHGYDLVYGGAKVGIMGAIADATLSEGGRVFGVIPKFLEQQEAAHNGLTHLDVVETMEVRKNKMIEMSDAFICLPGGIGSMEEFFDVWSRIKTRNNKKPLAIFNINNYFDNLILFLNTMKISGFAKEEYLNKLILHSAQKNMDFS